MLKIPVYAHFSKAFASVLQSTASHVCETQTLMRGKRRRSAWLALDDAHVDLFSPSRTTATRTDSAILVTSELPNDPGCKSPSNERITQPAQESVSNDVDSPQETPSSALRFTEQTPQSRVKAHLHQDSDDDHRNDSNKPDSHSEKLNSPASSTPLVVTRQDILSARRQLKMSPSTPSSEHTVFLDPQVAKEARALLFSAKRRRNQVTTDSEFATQYSSPPGDKIPDASGDGNALFDTTQHAFSPPFDQPGRLEDTADIALDFDSVGDTQSHVIPSTHRPLSPTDNRRASTGSAVTPLPLRFESPQRNPNPKSPKPPPLSTLPRLSPPPPPPLPPELPHKISSPITPAVRPALGKHLVGADKSSALNVPPNAKYQPVGFTTAAGRALRPTAVPAAFADLFDTPNEPMVRPSSRTGSKLDAPLQKRGTERNRTLDPTSPAPQHLQHRDTVKGASSNFKEGVKQTCSLPPETCGDSAGGAAPLASSVKDLDKSHFKTGAGNSVELPLFTTGKGAPIEPPLFTTGTGKPIAHNPPQARVQKNLETSLFTTGGGKPVDVPMRLAGAKLASDSSLFSTGSGKAIEAPLFSTGGGKPIGSTLFAAANTGSDVDTPLLKTERESCTPLPLDLQQSDPGKLSAKSNGSSTFRTPSPAIRLGFAAAEAGAALPTEFSMLGRDLASTEQRRALRGLITPSGKTPPTDELRKMLFKDSGRGRKPGKRGRGRGRAGSIASGLKTTPFKSPRIIRRSKTVPNPIEKNVPRLHVPRSIKNSGLTCGNKKCTCHESNGETRESNEPRFGDFHVLKECQDFVFAQSQKGCVQCLPDGVNDAKSLWGFPSFGVSNCIEWIHKLFDSKKGNGAATCVGSDAWVRMSYALAVNKLWRLSLEKGEDQCYFTATGVVRELLRRIDTEWHRSKQPWLLRIMRGDTNAGCHFVAKIVEFEVSPNGEIVLILTDGWYVARAKLDADLKKMVTKGWLRAGEKIHLMGASLQTGGNARTIDWVFGAGDELSSGFLRLHRNSVFKVPKDRQRVLKMGVQPMVFAKGLKSVIEDGGLVSGITVVVLRSYATCYMESKLKVVVGPDGEEDEETVHIWRREEAEEAARLEHESEVLKKRLDREEHRRQQMLSSKREGVDDQESGKDIDEQNEIRARQVTAVQELLICGVGDDANVGENRKLLRVFNVPEDIDRLLQRPGTVLHVRNVTPRKRGVWTCRPDAICEAKRNLMASPTPTLTRIVATVDDLKNGVVDRGRDFDGVFYVVYRAVTQNHFVYLSDDTGDAVSLVALQVCPSDVEFMPRALLPSSGKDLNAEDTFPIVVMTDVTFESELADLDVVHARTTLRTAILAPRKSSNSILKRKFTLGSSLEDRAGQLERRLSNAGETLTQLQILREAVASFCSGQRPSVAAYFSSTQEV